MASEGTQGRGVYASRSIPRHTILGISPVLFSKEEYEQHGKHTLFDHYRFKWQDGRMVLTPGLGMISGGTNESGLSTGSPFNYSDPSNVSYTHDMTTNTIRYVTSRDIEPGEELCIFYGHNLWFQPSEGPSSVPTPEDTQDGWSGPLSVHEAPESFQGNYPYTSDDVTILPEDDLPFIRYKLPPEEEDIESVRKVMAWVVDVPDQRQIANLLKWMKRSELETPDLGHLKRIRKLEGVTSFLLTASDLAPALPEEFQLPEPYRVPVSATSALTPVQLKLKNILWPTIYTPSRKDEHDSWTWDKVRWAWKAASTAIRAAKNAKDSDELPIAAHVPAPFENPELFGSMIFTAHDTRNSTSHPLRHAVLNVARRVADYHASIRGSPAVQESVDVTSEEPEKGRTNGSSYLLTSLTLFTTHEPCIMCSMALIHSRVKEIFYLFPMTETGGCGGSACLPTLKGVNHRFGIYTWKEEYRDIDSLYLEDEIDA